MSQPAHPSDHTLSLALSTKCWLRTCRKIRTMALRCRGFCSSGLHLNSTSNVATRWMLAACRRGVSRSCPTPDADGKCRSSHRRSIRSHAAETETVRPFVAETRQECSFGLPRRCWRDAAFVVFRSRRRANGRNDFSLDRQMSADVIRGTRT